ncbi:MAG: hypothetical protein V4726_13720 [Verrucomicrobiota bacterium]
MKNFLPALLCLAMTAVCPAGGEASPAPELPLQPPVAAAQIKEPEPVPVPETVGVSVLAGVAFLMMFGRRRYS